MEHETEALPNCCCGSLTDLAVVPMGGEGLDERVFATFVNDHHHGGDQWWLYVSSCGACKTGWMIGQDERIYDNYYLRRLTEASLKEIVETGNWPDEFITYERVLRLGKTMSKPWTFADPSSPSLVSTVVDLRRERPDISIDEIAYLLSISVATANDLDARSPPACGRG